MRGLSEEYYCSEWILLQIIKECGLLGCTVS